MPVDLVKNNRKMEKPARIPHFFEFISKNSIKNHREKVNNGIKRFSLITTKLYRTTDGSIATKIEPNRENFSEQYFFKRKYAGKIIEDVRKELIINIT